MVELDKDKFIVIKTEDAKMYLSETEKYHLAQIVGQLAACRMSDNKKQNEYLVVNQDEPYASQVWKLIQEGEEYKAARASMQLKYWDILQERRPNGTTTFQLKSNKQIEVRIVRGQGTTEVQALVRAQQQLLNSAKFFQYTGEDNELGGFLIGKILEAEERR